MSTPISQFCVPPLYSMGEKLRSVGICAEVVSANMVEMIGSNFLMIFISFKFYRVKVRFFAVNKEIPFII